MWLYYRDSFVSVSLLSYFPDIGIKGGRWAKLSLIASRPLRANHLQTWLLIIENGIDNLCSENQSWFTTRVIFKEPVSVHPSQKWDSESILNTSSWDKNLKKNQPFEILSEFYFLLGMERYTLLKAMWNTGIFCSNGNWLFEKTFFSGALTLRTEWNSYFIP